MSIIAPIMAPTNVTVDGCNVRWSYSDPDDVDGYVVYIMPGEPEKIVYTNITIKNPNDEPSIAINSTWSVSIRAHQHLIGPVTDEVIIGE